MDLYTRHILVFQNLYDNFVTEALSQLKGTLTFVLKATFNFVKGDFKVAKGDKNNFTHFNKGKKNKSNEIKWPVRKHLELILDKIKNLKPG